MAVYLLVNLYNAESVSIYKTAATELFEIVFKRSSTEGFVMNPGKLTLASSRSAATIATTPITAPHMPSKNAASVYEIGWQFKVLRHTLFRTNFSRISCPAIVKMKHGMNIPIVINTAPPNAGPRPPCE